MNRIKQLRKQHGMKQEELANLLNIQRSVVSRYEADKISLTSDNLNKLSEIFNVSIDYILCKSNDPMPYNKKESPTYSELHKKQTLEEFLMNNDELSEEAKKIMLSNLDLVKKLDKAKQLNEVSRELRPRLNY